MTTLTDISDLEEFFENSLSGFIITDPDGLIIRANECFAKWMGLKPDQLKDQRFSDYLSISGKIYVETHLAPLLRMQGTYDEVALELAPANGPRIPVLVNARESRDANGEPKSVALVIFKSAQRRQYETELLSVRNELRDLNLSLLKKVQDEVHERLTAEGRLNAEHEAAQLREQFIAVLGHDLRNPLAGMEAGLKMILRTQLDEKTDFNSFLDAEKCRANERPCIGFDWTLRAVEGAEELEFNIKTVQLEPIIAHVVSEIVAVSPENTIEVQVDLPEPIECDPMRIAQMLSNLVANAISHGETGGTVKVNASSASAMVEISVSNRGATIPPAVLERLFQPFFRSETEQTPLGLGLGLYISSEIARAHGGELKAHSAET